MAPQTDVVEFLSSPAAHDGATVERIDTHGAMVFLSGDRALKLKRAVEFDYMDFSTLEKRRAACEAEVRVNRRTAPSIYRGVVAVTREADGSLALDGAGPAVDWCVDMARFDQGALFDRLASRHALDLSLMRPLAASVAELHRGAERCSDHGGRAGLQWVIEGNAAGFADQGRDVLDPERCMSLSVRALSELRTQGDLLERRRKNGFVRRCHGDLHLRNIVLLDGRPTPFDAIEFNDEIACVDVWYDLAFLLMDLWRRALPSHANAVLNGYLASSGDDEGLALLPLFLSCRAAVRAKTSATAAGMQEVRARRLELASLAREHLALASMLLRPAAPQLCAIGGYSGSGKSTVARALAPSMGRVPGAVVLRSDELRKALCGVPEHDRLGPEGYTPEVSRRVYRTMVDRARAALAAGQTVVADAVFADPADRAAIASAAADVSVPFTAVWLDAPAAVLAARVERRPPDASDADAQVVAGQIAGGPGPLEWPRVDATPDFEAVVDAVNTAWGTATMPPVRHAAAPPVRRAITTPLVQEGTR